MDKNTIYGMLMMGLVIFGFMYLNKSDQEKLQQQLQEQTELQQQKEALEAEKALIVDSILPSETAAAPAILRLAGVSQDNDPESGAETFTYRTKNVDLAYDGTKISGTVKAVDTVLSFDAVANSRFGDDLTLENRKAAVANLRGALTDADRYRGFARHLSGDEQIVNLSNDLLSLDITSHGGNIAQATLLDYFNYLPKEGTKDFDTTRVNVWQLNEAGYNFILTSATQRFDTSNFYFTPEVVNDSTVMMKLDLGPALHLAARLLRGEDGHCAARHGECDSTQRGHSRPLLASAHGTQRTGAYLRGAQLRTLLQICGRFPR